MPDRPAPRYNVFYPFRRLDGSIRPSIDVWVAQTGLDASLDVEVIIDHGDDVEWISRVDAWPSQFR